MPSTVTIEISRPPLTLLSTEPWRAALEFLAFKFNDVEPRKMVPAGDGNPVTIFPGLATDSSAIAPLRVQIIGDRLGQTPASWQPYSMKA